MQRIFTALKMLLAMTVCCGLLYPLALTGLSQLIFPYEANGSIIEQNGRAIGSELIGQEFAAAKYFSSRPSATGYDAANSGGTNYGPANAKLKEQAAQRAAELRSLYGLTEEDPLPAVMVLNSASGFDPHLTPAAVYLQVERVAAARNLSPDAVKALADRHIEQPALGFIGEARVNVLRLNLALDALSGQKS